MKLGGRVYWSLFKDGPSLTIKTEIHIYLYFLATKYLCNNVLVEYIDN